MFQYYISVQRWMLNTHDRTIAGCSATSNNHWTWRQDLEQSEGTLHIITFADDIISIHSYSFAKHPVTIARSWPIMTARLLALTLARRVHAPWASGECHGCWWRPQTSCRHWVWSARSARSDAAWSLTSVAVSSVGDYQHPTMITDINWY